MEGEEENTGGGREGRETGKMAGRDSEEEWNRGGRTRREGEEGKTRGRKRRGNLPRGHF